MTRISYVAVRIITVAAFVASPPAAFSEPATLNELAAQASCLIEARSVIRLSSPTQGTIATVDVVRGDKVTSGQTIAKLESRVEEAVLEASRLKAESSLDIRAKEAQLLNAKKSLARATELSKRGLYSDKLLEETQTAAEVAELSLEQTKFEKVTAEIEVRRIEATIARRVIRSPVDGVVTSVDLHAGEFADPAAPIAIIAEVQPLIVEAYLPVEAFNFILPGAKAEVRPQEPIGGVHTANVLSRDPRIDAASGLFRVTFELANKDGAIPAGIKCALNFPP